MLTSSKSVIKQGSTYTSRQFNYETVIVVCGTCTVEALSESRRVITTTVVDGCVTINAEPGTHVIITAHKETVAVFVNSISPMWGGYTRRQIGAALSKNVGKKSHGIDISMAVSWLVDNTTSPTLWKKSVDTHVLM